MASAPILLHWRDGHFSITGRPKPMDVMTDQEASLNKLSKRTQSPATTTDSLPFHIDLRVFHGSLYSLTHFHHVCIRLLLDSTDTDTRVLRHDYKMANCKNGYLVLSRVTDHDFRMSPRNGECSEHNRHRLFYRPLPYLSLINIYNFTILNSH